MNQIKTKLSVSGMSCAHCELTIENTLFDIKGVDDAKASFGKGEVIVTFDEEVVKLEAQIQTGTESANVAEMDGLQLLDGYDTKFHYCN